MPVSHARHSFPVVCVVLGASRLHVAGVARDDFVTEDQFCTVMCILGCVVCGGCAPHAMPVVAAHTLCRVAANPCPQLRAPASAAVLSRL